MHPAPLAALRPRQDSNLIEGVNNALPTRKEDTLRSLRYNFSEWLHCRVCTGQQVYWSQASALTVGERVMVAARDWPVTDG